MIKRLCLTSGLGVLFFLVLEGFCSSLFVAYQLSSPAEHRTLSAASMQYDKDLGWVSVPNFYDKNYYAPSIFLRTNSQGFRARENFTERVPLGKVRIICSGDSQTFGDGVDNDHSWCQLLESLDDRFQTVNIAESGYGLDQMYLKYKRDGVVLDHDVHIFAFVADDFRRMRLTSLVGYGKPVLKLQDGELATGNVPVPKRSQFSHWLALKPHPLLQFRSAAGVAWLLLRLLPAREQVASNGFADEQQQILDKMIEDLQTINRHKNSVFVLVYLPRRSDYEPDAGSLALRAWIRAESEKKGLQFVDLVDDFQTLPVTMRDGMYIWPGSVQYFAETPGHYNDQGHEYVAKKLYSRLISMPQVAEKLGLRSGAEVTEQSLKGSIRGAGYQELSK
jgi:hypothetical protein